MLHQTMWDNKKVMSLLLLTSLKNKLHICNHLSAVLFQSSQKISLHLCSTLYHIYRRKQQFVKCLLVLGKSFEMPGLFLTWPRRSYPHKCCERVLCHSVHARPCFSAFREQERRHTVGTEAKSRLVKDGRCLQLIVFYHLLVFLSQCQIRSGSSRAPSGCIWWPMRLTCAWMWASSPQAGKWPHNRLAHQKVQ